MLWPSDTSMPALSIRNNKSTNITVSNSDQNFGFIDKLAKLGHGTVIIQHTFLKRLLERNFGFHGKGGGGGFSPSHINFVRAKIIVLPNLTPAKAFGFRFPVVNSVQSR